MDRVRGGSGIIRISFDRGERALVFAGATWKWVYGGIKCQHIHVASIGAGARWPFASRRDVVCCISIQGPKPRRESSKPPILRPLDLPYSIQKEGPMTIDNGTHEL